MTQRILRKDGERATLAFLDHNGPQDEGAPMDFEITRDAGIATAGLSGLALLEGWEEMLPRLGAQTAGDRRLLMVIEGLVGFLGTPERRKVGELAATCLHHLERVAMLVPPEKKTGVTENEARRLGLEFRVFADRDAAMQWLQS